MKKLKKWTEVYPQGTQEGNEEQRFFIALARNKKYDWRSIAAIAMESKLPKKRVEEILKKYHSHPTCPVFHNSKNEDTWAYWERVPLLCPSDTPSISDIDQKKRMEKITPQFQVQLGGGSGLQSLIKTPVQPGFFQNDFLPSVETVNRAIKLQCDIHVMEKNYKRVVIVKYRDLAQNKFPLWTRSQGNIVDYLPSQGETAWGSTETRMPPVVLPGFKFDDDTVYTIWQPFEPFHGDPATRQPPNCRLTDIRGSIKPLPNWKETEVDEFKG